MYVKESHRGPSFFKLIIHIQKHIEIQADTQHVNEAVYNLHYIFIAYYN